MSNRRTSAVLTTATERVTLTQGTPAYRAIPKIHSGLGSILDTCRPGVSAAKCKLCVAMLATYAFNKRMAFQLFYALIPFVPSNGED